MPIPERRDLAALRIGQQSGHLAQAFRLEPEQRVRAELDRDRPLGVVAQREAGNVRAPSSLPGSRRSPSRPRPPSPRARETAGTAAAPSGARASTLRGCGGFVDARGRSPAASPRRRRVPRPSGRAGPGRRRGSGGAVSRGRSRRAPIRIHARPRAPARHPRSPGACRSSCCRRTRSSPSRLRRSDSCSRRRCGSGARSRGGR